MFTVWGKKLVYRSLGHVADFCPICHGPQAFELQRVGVTGHLFYLSFGRGELVGHRRVCARCETAYSAQPAHYRAIATTPQPFDELQAETFPTLLEAWKHRLALERRMRISVVSRAERRRMLRAPFVLLSPKFEQHCASTHLDREVGFAALAMVAMLCVGTASMSVIPSPWAVLVLLPCIAIGAGLVAWQIAAARRRYLRRKIVPVLAAALKPLRPSPSELATALAETRRAGHRIGAGVSVTEIARRMRRRA